MSAYRKNAAPERPTTLIWERIARVPWWNFRRRLAFIRARNELRQERFPVGPVWIAAFPDPSPRQVVEWMRRRRIASNGCIECAKGLCSSYEPFHTNMKPFRPTEPVRNTYASDEPMFPYDIDRTVPKHRSISQTTFERGIVIINNAERERVMKGERR